MPRSHQEPDRASLTLSPEAPVELLRDDLQAHAVKMTSELRAPYFVLVRMADQDPSAQETLTLVEPILKKCSFLAGAAAEFDDISAFRAGLLGVVTALAQIGSSIDAVVDSGYGDYEPCQQALRKFCEAEARDNLALLLSFRSLVATAR